MFFKSFSASLTLFWCLSNCSAAFNHVCVCAQACAHAPCVRYIKTNVNFKEICSTPISTPPPFTPPNTRTCTYIHYMRDRGGGGVKMRWKSEKWRKKRAKGGMRWCLSLSLSVVLTRRLNLTVSPSSLPPPSHSVGEHKWKRGREGTRGG